MLEVVRCEDTLLSKVTFLLKKLINKDINKKGKLDRHVGTRQGLQVEQLGIITEEIRSVRFLRCFYDLTLLSGAKHETCMWLQFLI